MKQRSRPLSITEKTKVNSSWHPELSSPAHLSYKARLVIAMIGNKITSPEEIGVKLGVKRQNLHHLRRFVEEIRRTALRNRMVRSCLTHGLPPEYVVELPAGKRVRCYHCGYYTFYLPCTVCFGCEINDRVDDEPLMMPAEPTNSMPGTWGKIEVMRQRISRGESPFHPQDASDMKSPVMQEA